MSPLIKSQGKKPVCINSFGKEMNYNSQGALCQGVGVLQGRVRQLQV